MLRKIGGSWRYSFPSRDRRRDLGPPDDLQRIPEKSAEVSDAFCCVRSAGPFRSFKTSCTACSIAAARGTSCGMAAALRRISRISLANVIGDGMRLTVYTIAAHREH